jgi:predicted nucleic acid-binding protein
MTAGRSIFDTNIFLYLYSDGNPEKQKRARDLYREHASPGAILVRTQVIQEFYAAATRKMRMPQPTARGLTEAMCELPLVIVTPVHIRSAMDNEQRYRISFWDGLILAAAEAGGAEVLYTEDLNDGQRYGTVLARNLFR